MNISISDEQRQTLRETARALAVGHCATLCLKLYADRIAVRPENVIPPFDRRGADRFKEVPVSIQSEARNAVRPTKEAERPERTKGKYCVFDEAHQDYLYTPVWVEFLRKELSDPAKYAAAKGKSAPLKYSDF